MVAASCWPFRFALQVPLIRWSKNGVREIECANRFRFLLFFFVFVRACEREGYATMMRSRWRFVRFCLPQRRYRFFFVRTELSSLRCPSSPRPRPPRLRTYDSRVRNENCVTPRSPCHSSRRCIREKNRIMLRT